MTTLNEIPDEPSVAVESHLTRVQAAPPKPRVWPALLVGALSVPAVFIAGLMAWAPFQVAHRFGANGEEFWNWMSVENRFGTLTLLFIVFVQLTFLALALIAAVLSPHRLSDRLGLGRGTFQMPAIILFALSSIFVAAVGGYAVDFILDVPADAFDHHGRMFLASSSGMLLALFLASSLLPAVAEEALFRGYVQRRLLRRWPVWIAIGVTAVLFASMHLHFYHAMMLLPSAVWLGVIAWRADSIWPTVACHFTINATWFVTSMLHISGSEDIVIMLYWFLFALSFVAFLASIAILLRPRNEKTRRR